MQELLNELLLFFMLKLKNIKMEFKLKVNITFE